MATPQSPLPATALGHAQLTVGATAVSLPDPPARTKRTLIRIVNEPVNWRDDADEAARVVRHIQMSKFGIY